MILTWNLDQLLNLTRETRQSEKDLTMTSCNNFFLFIANLQPSGPSGSRIPDACSVELIFSLLITFYLTKSENRTKTSLTQLSCYCFELRWFFSRKLLIFLQRKRWHQQNEGDLDTKKYIFWDYLNACTYVPNFKFLA